jgi:hypothetical protein
MDSIKSFLPSPCCDGNKNVLRKSFEFASDKTKPSQRPKAEAQLKSGELTPEQLAEVFHWLSLY